MPGSLLPLALNRVELPSIPLVNPVTLIGRDPLGDVCLPYPSVSRRHCCLIEADRRWFVRDLGSTHGVWVNGQRVRERGLSPGDELAIGSLFFQFRIRDDGRTGNR